MGIVTGSAFTGGIIGQSRASESINNFKQKLEDGKNPISNCLKVEDRIRNEFKQMINSIFIKFDQRKEFYQDLVFFCLIEVSDYIGLLASNVGCNIDDTKKVVIEKIMINILINAHQIL